MATSRCLGRSASTARPPIETDPVSCVSSPAMILSSVDFPQPDGPSSVRNSPSAMSSETPRSTATAPKFLVTPSMVTPAIF
jgi:hypothetical protein